MTVLAVVSPKGGVGKTTVALNLSLSFARRGWSVLLVDTDPQGAIGLSLMGRAKESPGLVECVSNQIPLEKAILTTRLGGLSILPIGRIPFRQLAQWAVSVSDGRRLRPLFQKAEKLYDLVIADTGSGLSGVTYGVMSGSTHLLSPLQSEPLSLRAMPQLLEIVTGLQERGLDLQIAGLLLTMVQRQNEVSLSVLRETWKLVPKELLLDTFIPREPAFLDASAKGAPLGLVSRRPPRVAIVFDQLAAELEHRIGLTCEESEDEPLSLLD